MNVKLFRGKPEQLEAEVQALILGGSTDIRVTKLVAGHYLIIYN